MTGRSHGAPIAVVGGGVSGLTTATLLQLSGRQTKLYCSELATQQIKLGSIRPDFASLHAAASILPHTVRSKNTGRWTETSQAFFCALAFRAECGVRVQRHYEVFEAVVEQPLYAAALTDFKIFNPENPPPAGTPARRDAPSLMGWSFDVFFCEAPTYLQYLYNLFLGLGGQFAINEPPGTRLASYLGGDHAFIVNCCGLGAYDFLDLPDGVDLPDMDSFQPVRDQWPARVVRGHWIRADLGRALHVPSVGPISYNYTPLRSVYPGVGQVAADVYCYPRSDAWILGGSRQERVNTPDGPRWVGDDEDVDYVLVPDFGDRDVRIPAPILTLNDEIVGGLTNGQIQLQQILRTSPALFRAGIGYRFERSHPEEGIRLEASRVRHKGRDYAVIHNYGHGGAGFTLAWGCANDVLGKIVALVAQGWPAPGVTTSVDPDFLVVQRLLKTVLDKESPTAVAGEIKR